MHNGTFFWFFDCCFFFITSLVFYEIPITILECCFVRFFFNLSCRINLKIVESNCVVLSSCFNLHVTTCDIIVTFLPTRIWADPHEWCSMFYTCNNTVGTINFIYNSTFSNDEFFAERTSTIRCFLIENYFVRVYFIGLSKDRPLEVSAWRERNYREVQDSSWCMNIVPF